MPGEARNRGETALAGTLVVELGSRIGAGVCGSLLAQLGATVVLVEASDAEADAGKWRHRAQFAAGKLSVRPDSAAASDRGLLRDLVACCDAVIVSSDVDGRSDDAVPAGSEGDKVICDVTAYGHSGALSGRPDTEWQIQALSGIVETTGMADGAPVPIPLPIVEFMTGVYAAASTIAALRVRCLSGAGQTIDVALYDSAFSAMATFLPRVLAGSTEALRRAGNRHAMISPWNVYKASDGWILICVGSDAQWQRLCEIMGRPELRADARFAKTPDRLARAGETDALVQAWVEMRGIADCVGKLNEAQIACGPIVRIDGSPREPNLDHRGMIRRLHDPVTSRDILMPGSPLRMSASGGVAPGRVPTPDADRKQIARLIADRRARVAGKPAAPPRAALAGIRIVEIGHYTTVPLSTRLLASLGAEVIKIEPPEGEATRDWPPTQRGQGYFFTYTNSDKRSLVLDLRKDADTAILGDLIRGADVLIENLKPGTLARRGFSADDVAKLNPALIYCSISGFGAHSLYGGRPAYDSVVQAMSGIMDLVRSDGVPLKTGISSADLMGAEMGVLAVLAALAYRDRTGRGQYVDLSMQDIAAWLTQTAWNGEDAGRPPVCVMPCSDGHIVAEMDLAGLAPDLLGPDAASGVPLSRQEAAARLMRAGISAAPVLTVHEMLAEPHTSSRRLWFSVTENGETWPLLASPLRLSGTPATVSRPMPALGRDTAAILAALPRQPGVSHKTMPSDLFSPFRLRQLELANRIVVSPMAQYSAQNGCATDWHQMHLGNLCISGAGLVIIEATSVERDGRLSPGDLGLWCDENEAALAPILAFCRRHGAARIGLQLQHAGRKGSVTLAWEKQREIPMSEGGWAIHSADAIPYPGRMTPIALDKPMIARLLASYAKATRRADRLGIDLIEIHSAHGYLLHNFLSPLSNQRQDAYGGDRDKRMRFVLEVFDAVRAVWPAHKPVGVRISATDWAEGGWAIEDSVVLAQRLKALGCDYITASSGGTVPEQKIEVHPGYQVPFAERIRKEAGIATMAVGLITQARQAEGIIASGRADFVAIGRGMLYDPRWPWHAATELGEEAFYPPQYERSHPSMRRGDFLKPTRRS